MGLSKDLSTETKASIVQFLLQDLQNDKSKRGKFKEAANTWGCNRRTISRIWAETKKQTEAGQLVQIPNKRFSVKRKRIEIDMDLIASLELFKRSTIRRLATGINCSKSVVGRWVNKGLIRSHSNAIKPDLTAPNKLLRLRFSLDAIEYDRVQKVLKFRSMENIVHIDEKWFYISKTSHRFYLTPDEEDPHRSCKSKKFITKIMFMCAVCRPLFNDDGSVLFDGKIGIFPFTESVPAKRRSKNRAAGTMKTKPIASITKEVIKYCLINKIIPAIKSKWPAQASKIICIQQDNAKPHIKDKDPEFRDAATRDGFQITLTHQPPNSPDTNVNDLGWFRAIQSLQTENSCKNVDELVNAVINSFEMLTAHTLNAVFLSLQGCMVEILKVRGHNSYKLPHMKKGTLMRENRLPLNLEIPADLVKECVDYLRAAGIVDGIEDLMQMLGIQQET